MNLQGAPYPITKDARGLLHSQDGVRQIKSDLLILLMTDPGERVMLPQFGTPLKRLIFEPNDPELFAQARQMIASSIAQWEPRITVQSIDVGLPATNPPFDQSDVDNGGNLLWINISFFDPKNITEVQNLTLEVPIGGGQ